MTIPIKIQTEFLNIDTTIQPNRVQKNAAWELYVELLTRISTVPLQKGSGLLREAMDSLYSLFSSTRRILRVHGPEVARKTRKAEFSVGYLALTILNRALRPFLSKWHPLLLDHEEKRTEALSMLEHEKGWSEFDNCHSDLEKVRQTLAEYSDILATICEVPKYATDRKREIQ